MYSTFYALEIKSFKIKFLFFFYQLCSSENEVVVVGMGGGRKG